MNDRAWVWDAGAGGAWCLHGAKGEDMALGQDAQAGRQGEGRRRAGGPRGRAPRCGEVVEPGSLDAGRAGVQSAVTGRSPRRRMRRPPAAPRAPPAAPAAVAPRPRGPPGKPRRRGARHLPGVGPLRGALVRLSPRPRPQNARARRPAPLTFVRLDPRPSRAVPPTPPARPSSQHGGAARGEHPVRPGGGGAHAVRPCG
jgi:hypothetical protein